MTIVKWLPMFVNPEISDIVIESLRYMQREKNTKIYAYVIMKTHLHCILQSTTLNKTIKEFKSYTARRIIDYLKEQKDTKLLEKLKQAKLRYKIESDYQFWQEGSHPEAIVSDEMMYQKMEYIHFNPVRKGYVDNPCDWLYSTARDYEGKEGLVNIQTEW